MEQPSVVAGNFAQSFSLNFLSIFVHISGSIRRITLIWASLERYFPPAEVEYRWCQFWLKAMTSEVEERPRFVTGGYGQHRSQWVKLQKEHKSRMDTRLSSLSHQFWAAAMYTWLLEELFLPQDNWAVENLPPEIIASTSLCSFR